MIRVAFVIGDYPPDQLKLRADTAAPIRRPTSRSASCACRRGRSTGWTPAEIQAAAPIFHDAFRQAEREGYDAVVPLGMLDIGVDGGRSAVDIPVIAPLQAALHVAALVGDRFGVVCYHPSAIARHRAQCMAYGMESWIAGRRASGFYVQHIAANKDRMIESFLMAARDLIDKDGADVIIPQGITQCPVQMKPQWLSRAARRAGGGRDRRADPDGGADGGARAQAQPRALAEGGLAAAVITRANIAQRKAPRGRGAEGGGKGGKDRPAVA